MPLGILCVGYRNSAALGAGYATPTFNELGGVMDLQISISYETFEASTRREKGVRVYEPTMAEIEVTGKMRIPEVGAIAGDPDFDDLLAFLAAYRTRGVLDCMFLDGATDANGSEGIRGFWKIAKWDEDQSNGVSTFKDFVLKPAPVDKVTIAATATAQAMRHVKVAAGAPTYSNWGLNTFA